jgi:hypothetical protein
MKRIDVKHEAIEWLGCNLKNQLKSCKWPQEQSLALVDEVEKYGCYTEPWRSLRTPPQPSATNGPTTNALKTAKECHTLV